MYCEICGAFLEKGSNYCDSCGAAVSEDTPPVTPVPAFASVGAAPRSLRPFLLLGIVVLVAVGGILAYRSGLIQSLAGAVTGRTVAQQAEASLTPEQMITEINGFCRDLDAAKSTGRIGAMEVFNFCSSHSSYMALALASEPTQLRSFYQNARNEYRALKGRAGLDPNTSQAEMEKVKAPAKVLLSRRLSHQLGGRGESIAGQFTIRDTEYEFVADGQTLDRQFAPSAHAGAYGYSGFTGATAGLAERGTLISSQVFGCMLQMKPDGHTDWYHTYFTEDQQSTIDMCNTLDAAIKAFNRANPRAY